MKDFRKLTEKLEYEMIQEINRLVEITGPIKCSFEVSNSEAYTITKISNEGVTVEHECEEVDTEIESFESQTLIDKLEILEILQAKALSL